ncbi:thiolase family protein [Amycolatopsis sp. NBC_01286]|uniref:thiolase family protein n=1 Tax=Amycolatopsis sp. NBC_01286 TaxID=2903560 RepID=UPI002E151161|nr:acetyl-CoA C-acyltransferase [Amycolatopsis sp. NBC_01286]
MTASVLLTVRTPRGKASPRGGLASVPPLSLVTSLLDALVARGLDPAVVDQVILGCASQTGEQGANLARTAVLAADWPVSVAGMTVNRFCSSGLDAVALGAALIRAGEAEVVVAGGVESVSRVPMFTDGGPLWTEERFGAGNMGIAADLVAADEGFTRPELDAYGLRTQQLAATAWKDGRYDESLVPVAGLTHDEHVRPSTSAEALAELPSSFGGLHTRGTSPSLADGAGLVLLASPEAAARLGLAPRANVLGSVTAGSDPIRMLLSGQLAVSRLLDRHGVHPSEVDVVEFAEAFAALCLKIRRDLGFGDDVFNVNGGTIAMGHAFGATGAILLAGCVDELTRRGGRYGVTAVSGAAGSGTAVLVERAV